VLLACHPLHGLGFAGAIVDKQLQGSDEWLSLLGFHLAIGLGKALFVVAVLAAKALLSRCRRSLARLRPKRHRLLIQGSPQKKHGKSS
jgi:hypothetical protein